MTTAEEEGEGLPGMPLLSAFLKISGGASRRLSEQQIPGRELRVVPTPLRRKELHKTSLWLYIQDCFHDYLLKCNSCILVKCLLYTAFLALVIFNCISLIHSVGLKFALFSGMSQLFILCEMNPRLLLICLHREAV